MLYVLDFILFNASFKLCSVHWAKNPKFPIWIPRTGISRPFKFFTVDRIVPSPPTLKTKSALVFTLLNEETVTFFGNVFFGKIVL